MTTPQQRPWYQRLLGGAPRRGRASYRPLLEALEDRTVPGFLSPASFGVDSGPFAVAVADVNGDGKPDLISANHNSNTVSVLLGNGNGTFQPALNFTTDARPLAIAVADVNRDGKPDLITANFIGNTVSVLLGNGDGAFQPAQNFSTGQDPRSVAVTDLN